MPGSKAGWNYRWFKIPDPGSDSGYRVACYEVYYTNNKPTSSTTTSVEDGPYDTVEEARRAFSRMLKALHKPLLQDTHEKLGYYAEVEEDEDTDPL